MEMIVDRGPFRRAALKRYISMMSKPNPTGIFDKFVADVLIEQGFAVEEDPRSVYDPQQLYDALQRYATSDSSYEQLDSNLEFGFRKAFKIFAKPKNMKPFRVLTDEEVVKNALKLDKSSGLPLMASKAKSLSYSFDRELQIRKGVKAPNPCVAFKRTQKGNKTRLVWGYPLEMTIMEARFARPLIDWFKSHPSPMAFGLTKCYLGACLNRYFEEGSGTTVCLDYSKYDTSITKSMILEAFRIISTWFSEEDCKQYGFETVVKYFIFTPIVMPDGHLYTGKDHGVPSGSYFTQLVDSIVNTALCYALSRKFGFFFKDRSLFVLGDDSIMQVQGVIDVTSWRKYLLRFGLMIHDDEKTVIGKVHFLGATWKKGKPDAPVGELVSKAACPESYREYDGNPHRGKQLVLRSYASNYLSAWKFIPETRSTYFDRVDRPVGFGFEDLQYLTGSDRFLAEEAKVSGVFSKSITDGSLSQRLLL